MLKIRLKRIGKKGEASYRVVVAQAHRARNSKSIDEIGFYNPRTKPSTFTIDQEAAKSWLAKGAQPTETVAQYFVKEGLLKALKKGSKQGQAKPKKKQAEQA